MQNWEHYLTKSLRQDISDLTKLAAKISTMMPSPSITTWLNPNKLYSSVDPPRGDGYVQCLEALLDKLYFVMNLLILYVTEGAPAPSVSRNVAKPKKLTMCGCMELLWVKLKEYTGKNTKTLATPSPGKEIAVQTINNVEEECKECSVNMGLIKNISCMLEDHRINSYVNIAKTNIQKNIYKLTQTECVRRMHASIEREVEFLLENFKTSKEELCQSRFEALDLDREKQELEGRLEQALLDRQNDTGKIDEFKCRNEELEKKTQELKRSFDLVEVELEKSKEELVSLRAKHDILISEKIAAEKESVLNKIKIKELELSMKHLEKERLLLQNAEKSVCKMLEHHVKDVKEKYHNNIDCEERQKMYRKEVEGEIEGFRNLLTGLTEGSVSMDNVMRRSERFLEERCETAEGLLRKIWEAVNDAITSKRVKLKQKVTGDPLFDMASQIELNKRHISLLTDENASLLRTIARYSSISPK